MCIRDRFDGANEAEIAECLREAGLRDDGKTILYDGRTGMPFDNPVTVGYKMCISDRPRRGSTQGNL